MLTDEIARRENCKRHANSLHPGIVTTNLVRYILPELTAEKRDPEAERATPQGRAMSKMGIRDGTRVRRRTCGSRRPPTPGA